MEVEALTAAGLERRRMALARPTPLHATKARDVERPWRVSGEGRMVRVDSGDRLVPIRPWIFPCSPERVVPRVVGLVPPGCSFQRCQTPCRLPQHGRTGNCFARYAHPCLGTSLTIETVAMPTVKGSYSDPCDSWWSPHHLGPMHQ